MMNTEILTYSRSHSVFAGITLNEEVFEQNVDSTRAIYGHDPSFRNIVSGRVRAQGSTRHFMNAVADIGRTGTIAGVNPGQQ